MLTNGWMILKIQLLIACSRLMLKSHARDCGGDGQLKMVSCRRRMVYSRELKTERQEAQKKNAAVTESGLFSL